MQCCLGSAKTGHRWPRVHSEVQGSVAETRYMGRPLPSCGFRMKARWAKSQLRLLLGETVLSAD